MPILTEDIKLMKSAVMADVPEGGGAMTGMAVVDGQSNNLFPDTSSMDRAIGRANVRKLFGAAQTDDVDMALGVHVIITDAPDDPLVHCTLMQTPGWADTRTAAQERIEKYLVKGPRHSYRLYDTHYAESLQIQLVSLVGGTPPVGGDALVLRNPGGQAEQFVRILRTKLETRTIAVIEGTGTVLLSADIVICTLGNKLDYDFFGPPAQRVGLNESEWAQVYTTNLAGGAQFYGIKPLALTAVPGDFSVTAAGGIYTPLVPAATVENLIVDVSPYTRRRTVSPSGYSNITAPSVTMTVGPGVVLKAPGPICPKSLALMLGGIAFSDSGDGLLLQGTSAVGAVDYSPGTITFGGAAPVYGLVVVSLTYRPATAVDADPYSAAFLVTGANQGRAYTNALTPLPAPGTLTFDYMVQGRWYTLSDAALHGKLAGADSSYGAGSINADTGSMAVTLGALPDVGSQLLASYGSAASATAYDLSTLPSALSTVIEIPWDKPLGTLRWTSVGVAKSATYSTGDAELLSLSGLPSLQRFRFTPTSIPDGQVTMDYSVQTPHSSTVIVESTVINPASTEYLNNNNGTYTLTDVVGTPMMEGSFSAQLTVRMPPNAVQPNSNAMLPIYDKGGRVLSEWTGPAGVTTVDLGSIAYDTGQIVLARPFGLSMWLRTYTPPSGQGWSMSGSYSNAIGEGSVVDEYMTQVKYQVGNPSETTYTSSEEITWTESTETMPVTLAGGWTLALPSSPMPDAINATVLQLGGALYTCNAGVLRSGWDVKTGMPAVANAGSLSEDGILSFSAVPAGVANVVTWANLTHDISSGLSSAGVFRTNTAPIKTGVFQLQCGESIGNANDTGAMSGDYTGSVDFLRGIVNWAGTEVDASALTYNAVGLEYLPLNKDLLGLDTVRLPLDGKVPIFRPADVQVVHNTVTTQLPNPLVKGTAYSLGRERIASVRVKDALGLLVPSSLYISDLDPGLITVPAASSLVDYTQPLSVDHRIEDMVVCAQADISGRIKFTSTLTHTFPAGSSFISSALAFGDLFARAYGYIEQATWTGEWTDELVGAAPSAANFNDGQCPVTVTNRGAITERWAVIRTNTTDFKVVGENVGDIGTGNTGVDCAPINPATDAPYFTLPALGWGNGWATGNVLRFNTTACAAPFWVVRTVLQGPATLQSDVFSLAFRLDVDRP